MRTIAAAATRVDLAIPWRIVRSGPPSGRDGVPHLIGTS